MSLLSTLVLAWAAVHTYVGIFHGILYLRRRADREYLAFSVMAFSLAAYCFGQVLLGSASDTAEGAQAMRIGTLGLCITAGTLIDLIHLLVGLDRSRLVWAGYAWSVLGACATLAGLFFDADRANVESFYYGEAHFLPLATIWALGAVVLCVAALLRASRWVAIDGDLRLLLGAVGLLAIAGVRDILVGQLGLGQPYVLEHASVATVFVISYMLLRRFVRADDELTRRTAELRRSYEELRTMQEELVRKEQLAAVGELSAVIAHEVRNPLAIMKNAAAGLRRSSLADQDRATLVDILDEEADRLNRLVRDLLAYARPVTLRGTPVDVTQIVQESVDTAMRGREIEGVTVELRLDEGPRTVHCDRELLVRALANVVENALQAMPAGGRLTVESSDAAIGPRAAISLVFHDTGEGMDTLVRSKARDPFFTTRPSGTGLGLAIVERVIRSHGGEVSIESRYGSGTTVSIALPVDRPSFLPQDAAVSESAAVEEHG